MCSKTRPQTGHMPHSMIPGAFPHDRCPFRMQLIQTDEPKYCRREPAPHTWNHVAARRPRLWCITAFLRGHSPLPQHNHRALCINMAPGRSSYHSKGLGGVTLPPSPCPSLLPGLLIPSRRCSDGANPYRAIGSTRHLYTRGPSHFRACSRCLRGSSVLSPASVAATASALPDSITPPPRMSLCDAGAIPSGVPHFSFSHYHHSYYYYKLNNSLL